MIRHVASPSSLLRRHRRKSTFGCTGRPVKPGRSVQELKQRTKMPAAHGENEKCVDLRRPIFSVSVQRPLRLSSRRSQRRPGAAEGDHCHRHRRRRRLAGQQYLRPDLHQVLGKGGGQRRASTDQRQHRDADDAQRSGRIRQHGPDRGDPRALEGCADPVGLCQHPRQLQFPGGGREQPDKIHCGVQGQDHRGVFLRRPMLVKVVQGDALGSRHRSRKGRYLRRDRRGLAGHHCAHQQAASMSGAPGMRQIAAAENMPA